ncbi:MAG: hypothetical protein OEY70_12075, partial [Acidimicrobiia bacterium]|nr:hypothetical protein [Acidimicrobiia bacterium]
AEIANAAGLPLLGVLPVDSRAAAVFDRGGLDSGRPFRRSALAQTVAELTEYVRSRVAEVLSGLCPAESDPQRMADFRGDPTGPAPSSPPPDPIAARSAPGTDAGRTADAVPVTEVLPAADLGVRPDGIGLPGPGPTRLSNPVAHAADLDNHWPPPRPVPAATDPAAPPTPPPPTPPPPPAHPPPPSAAYPGAAHTSQLPAGMTPGPGPAVPPPPSGVSALPPEAPAIPVSLAIAAARARGQAPTADTGKAGWPPPPPPDGPAPAPGAPA